MKSWVNATVRISVVVGRRCGRPPPTRYDDDDNNNSSPITSRRTSFMSSVDCPNQRGNEKAHVIAKNGLLATATQKRAPLYSCRYIWRRRNAGRENERPNKGREIVGYENAEHEIARHHWTIDTLFEKRSNYCTGFYSVFYTYIFGSRPSDHYFRSVCLSVFFLSVCLCRVFLNRLWSDFDQTRTYVICLGLVVSPIEYRGCATPGGWVTPKNVYFRGFGTQKNYLILQFWSDCPDFWLYCRTHQH